MRTQHPRRRGEPLAIQLLADRDAAGAPLSLPPLFPIPNATAPDSELQQLHDRLYHVIALALRAYMQTWYGKISPRDRELLPVVNRDVVVPLLAPLLSPLTTGEGRARLVDLALLDVPILLATHVQTYWAARADLFSPLAQAYHARLPTLTTAVAGDGYIVNPSYSVHLIDTLLARRLPRKDYGAQAERIVVREVLARVVLGAVGKRLSAAWFYAQVTLKQIGLPGDPLPRRNKEAAAAPPLDPPRKVYHAVRTAYTRLVIAITIVWSFSAWLIAFFSICPPPKPQHTRLADAPLVFLSALLGIDGRSGLATPTWPTRLAFSALQLVATLLSPVIDRVLPAFANDALTTANGLKLVALIERLLFPNDGWPSPPLIEPTQEEARALDADLRARVQEVLPVAGRRAVTSVPGYTEADALVDVLADASCNAHLVGLLLNAIVAALVPELADADTPDADDDRAALEKALHEASQDPVDVDVESVQGGSPGEPVDVKNDTLPLDS